MTTDLDLFTELDEFEAARDQAVETQTLEQRRANLESLRDRGGVMGQLASEALVAMDERVAKAERDAKIAESEEAIADGEPRWDDPAFVDGLRQSVLADREAATASFYALRRAELKARGWGEVSVEQQLQNDRAAMAEVERFHAASGDPLLDHPVYRAHVLAQHQQAAAVAVARARQPDMGAEQAQADVDATLRALVEAG